MFITTMEGCAQTHGLGQIMPSHPSAPLSMTVSRPARAQISADGLPEDEQALDALVPDQPINASLPPQPIPQLINTVFGDILRVPYVAGPDVAARTDVVALRSVQGMSKRSFFRLVQLALRTYGLRADIDQGVVKVVVDNAASAPAPYILKGRVPPPSPDGDQTSSQLFQAKVVQADALVGLIDQMFPQARSLTFSSDAASNSIVVTGLPRDVNFALEAMQRLDQPAFSGAGVLRARPVYWSAESLAERLTASLQGEGYNSAGAPGAPRSALVMPMSAANQVLVFARDPATLERARYWLGQLDQPDAFGSGQSTFIYQVQNTDAEGLSKLVTDGDDQGTSINRAGQPSAGAPGAPPASAASGSGFDRTSGSFHGGRLVVDRSGNRILFTGTAEGYGQLRSLLAALDSEPRQVLVEVTIAEVTLTDQTQLGLEWFFQHSMAGGVLSGGTQGGLGLAANGLKLNYVGKNLNAAFETFASNNNVNILSRPRLVARTGGEAHIQVGTDVPIITSQINSPTTTAGTTGILQTIQYRQTGIILHVKPLVYGDHHVELDITQEVSSEQNNPNAAIGSPLILDRNVETQLSLEEGATAVLGGLIDTSYTKGNSGIPLLKDVPILGQAFRNDTVSANKTELVVLVTPHILRNEDDMGRWADRYADEMNAEFRVGVSPSWTRILTPYDSRKDLEVSTAKSKVTGP